MERGKRFGFNVLNLSPPLAYEGEGAGGGEVIMVNSAALPHSQHQHVLFHAQLVEY